MARRILFGTVVIAALSLLIFDWLARSKAIEAVREMQQTSILLRQRLDQLAAEGAIPAAESTGPVAVKNDSAERAYLKGKAALAAGDGRRARVFFLNAVNQAPSRIEYLSAYADAATAAGAGEEELDRARAIVELAVYQVPAEQVDKTLAILKRLDRPSTQPATMPVDFRVDLSSLHAADPGIYKDAAKLDAKIDAARALVASLDDTDANDPGTADLRRQADAELARWAVVANFKRQCDYVDACLQKIEGGFVPPDSDAAVSILQAAENALPPFWGADLTQAPSELSEKIKRYPGRIADWAQRLGEVRSRPLLDELRRQAQDAIARANAAKLHETACQQLEGAAKAMNPTYAKITSARTRADADKTLEDLANAMRGHRAAQFNAYQHWALDKLDVAFTHWDNLHVYTSEQNALAIYENDKLYEIDPALLTPEVGRLHSDVLNRLFPNMSPTKQVEMWKKTQQGKRPLKEF